MELFLVILGLIGTAAATALAISQRRGRNYSAQVTLNYLMPDDGDEPLTPQLCNVAGVNKRALTGGHRQDIISSLRDGQPILLIPEHGNPHDPNAVTLFTKDGKDIGYLPREWAEEMAKRLDAGSPVTAKVAAVDVFETSRGKELLGVNLELTTYRKRRATKRKAKT